MYRCAQCVTTHTEQIDHISSREHAWLKSWKAQDFTSSCSGNNCHPRVMSHTFPHLTLTTITGSLSHPPPLSFRRSLQHTQDLRYTMNIYPAMFHGRLAGQHKSHLSQVVSPKRLSSKTSRPKRSNLETSSPEELSLEGILGRIRIKYRKDV